MSIENGHFHAFFPMRFSKKLAGMRVEVVWFDIKERAVTIIFEKVSYNL